MRFYRLMGVRVALATFAVALVAIAVITVGVLDFGRGTLEHLLMAHGATATAAREMFDETVLRAFVGALLAAIVASAVAASLFAYFHTRPLDRIDRAATQIAAGDFSARAPVSGSAEVRRLATSFNSMARGLQEEERLRRELIANTAHELRTPLTNLQGYLEGLRDGVVEPSTEIYASLHEEADRLVRLAVSLDQLAEGDLARDVILTETDLAASVRRAAELLRPQFRRRAIALEVLAPPHVMVIANPDHVEQVLHNLLQNAVRYGLDGGQASVVVEVLDKSARVHVVNDGEEIPEAELPHVFERFYRVEKSRDRAYGGAGIGLAIVKQQVELAGGAVGAESTGGRNRFWFSLPAAG